MAQFGLHALVGLWIVWSIPLFSPYVIRFSFGAGMCRVELWAVYRFNLNIRH